LSGWRGEVDLAFAVRADFLKVIRALQQVPGFRGARLAASCFALPTQYDVRFCLEETFDFDISAS